MKPLYFKVFAGNMFCGTLGVLNNTYIFMNREGIFKHAANILFYKKLKLKRYKRE